MPSLRIVLCMGVYCNRGGDAEDLHALLEDALGPARPAFMARGAPVHWERASCLSMCGAGPNLIVYEGGEEVEVVNSLTEEKLADLLARYGVQ